MTMRGRPIHATPNPSSTDYPRTFDHATGDMMRDGFKILSRDRSSPEPMPVIEPEPRRGFRNSEPMAPRTYPAIPYDDM